MAGVADFCAGCGRAVGVCDALCPWNRVREVEARAEAAEKALAEAREERDASRAEAADLRATVGALVEALREISERSMQNDVGDMAALVLLLSDNALASLPESARKYAERVAALEEVARCARNHERYRDDALSWALVALDKLEGHS